MLIHFLAISWLALDCNHFLCLTLIHTFLYFDYFLSLVLQLRLIQHHWKLKTFDLTTSDFCFATSASSLFRFVVHKQLFIFCNLWESFYSCFYIPSQVVCLPTAWVSLAKCQASSLFMLISAVFTVCESLPSVWVCSVGFIVFFFMISHGFNLFVIFVASMSTFCAFCASTLCPG